MTTFKRTRTSKTGKKIVETVNRKDGKGMTATKKSSPPYDAKAHKAAFEDWKKASEHMHTLIDGTSVLDGYHEASRKEEKAAAALKKHVIAHKKTQPKEKPYKAYDPKKDKSRKKVSKVGGSYYKYD